MSLVTFRIERTRFTKSNSRAADAAVFAFSRCGRQRREMSDKWLQLGGFGALPQRGRQSVSIWRLPPARRANLQQGGESFWAHKCQNIVQTFGRNASYGGRESNEPGA